MIDENDTQILDSNIERLEELLPWGWEESTFKTRNYADTGFPSYRGLCQNIVEGHFYLAKDHVSLLFQHRGEDIKSSTRVKKTENFNIDSIVSETWREFSNRLRERIKLRTNQAKEMMEVLGSPTDHFKKDVLVRYYE